MKGQMFILTIVFLVGLIFVVQQNLAGYSSFDLSEPFKSNDFYIFRDVRNMFEDTTETSATCDDARNNLRELNNYLGRKILPGGFTLSLEYSLDCAYWDNIDPNPTPVSLLIRIIGKNSETSGEFEIYHQVPPAIKYAEYWNPDRPENPCSQTPGQPYLVINSGISDPNRDPVTTAETNIILYNILDEKVYDETFSMFDDGLHDDGIAGDGVYGVVWDSTGTCPSGECHGNTIVRACDDRSCSLQEAYCIS